MFAQATLVKIAGIEIQCFILFPLTMISLIPNSKSVTNSKTMGRAQNISFLSFFEHMSVENRYIIVKQDTKPEGQSTRYGRNLQGACQK